MHRDLWVVGAGLDAQVAATARRVEVVAGEGREVAQRLGAAVGEPEAAVEERGAVPDGHREVPRREVERLAGVLGHLPRPAADGAPRGGLGAGRHPLGGARPAGQQVAQLGGVLRDDVERDEVQAVLGGRRDAGLVLAAEGDDPGIRSGRQRRVPGIRHGTGGSRGVGEPGDPGGGRPGPPDEHRPARRGGHDWATTPATVETGWAKASSASVSALTSAGVSSG